jgi:hypothetical protein
MKTVLDIAALVSAIVWPLVVVAVLLTYRKTIPELVKAIGRNIRKLEFAGVSIELAMATPAASEWQGGPKALDLRRSATSVEVTDSTAATFTAQLIGGGSGDYSEVDLGRGGEWLTSRLYIMSILFPRMKGVKAFVFLETTAEVRKRFVGWADPSSVRWALARRYPWLETAYADAYSVVIKNCAVVSNEGRLGFSFNPSDPGPALQLLQQFLANVQLQPPPAPLPAGAPAPAPPLPASPPLIPPPPEPASDWVLVSEVAYTYEHATWITGELLENVLRPDLVVSSVTDPGAATMGVDLVGAIAGQGGDYVAVTRSDGRLEYIVNRQALADQLVRSAPPP